MIARSAAVPSILLFALTAGSVHGAQAGPAGLADSDRTLSPYFFVENGDPDVDRLPLEGTDVTVTITGVIAAVTVKQVYKNDGSRPIHARYVFPASTRAAVHGMRMIVGNSIITAEIRERQEAKRTFEKAKSEGKSASLLEQQRPNVFTMSVANILPGDRIEVELDYTELLIPEDGVYELVYPTVVGPRYPSATETVTPERNQFVASPYTREGTPPVSTLRLRGSLAAGLPLSDVDSPSHRLHTRWDGSERVDFELDPGEARAGDRDVILRYRLAGGQIQSGLLLHEEFEESFFLLMVQPPARVAVDEVPAREYVFILDVSGSMHGFPLDTAKLLLRELVGDLRPVDRFNVILFSGAARLMQPESVLATPENLRLAVDVIDGEGGGGGTELLRALEKAVTLPHPVGMSRTFIVVTDGYISAEEEAFRYVRSNLGEANVFCFGIGSSVNRFLVEGLAKAGMGKPFVVTDHGTAPQAAARFREYIASPVLTDVEVRFDGFEAHEVEPSSVPDVLATRPVVLRGKWRGDPSGTITVSGMTGRGFWSREIDVADFVPHEENRPLRTLWARGRLSNLSDFNFGRPHGDDEREEITQLGLTYGLLTRYTSFVAVHDVVRNANGSAEDVDQPLPLPRGVSNLAIGRGPEPEFVVLALMVTIGLGIASLLRRIAA
jgi:Ca-activated chloride channel family protein